MTTMGGPTPGSSTPSARLSQISGHLSNPPSTASIVSSTPDTSPSSPAKESSVSPPSAILVFGWGGASASQAARHVANYSILYPSARVLVFDCPFSGLFPWPLSASSRRGSGVDKILEVCGPNSDDNNGLLVHIFSNGGSCRFSYMAARYFSDTKIPLPIRALVIDSAPSPSTGYEKAHAMSTTLLPRGPVRFLGLLVLLCMMNAMWIWSIVTWQYDPIAFARQVLNNPQIVSRESGRLYVYSREDQIVHWWGIEAHVEEARKAGFRLKVEKFEGSQHIKHLRHDPKRYWNAITRLWEESSDIEHSLKSKHESYDKVKED